ncbi:loganic acid O-methyltransferase-like isoform X2 [Salvia hispanica]|uniref:loganic acid O-methyltransferase-like isoform X2 n=1 Tax=Salvia hispanica TaxID=49212 RepID=UPI002009217F|nr:loganic acid O-methyltransferase-like isoform X2 [Salvia hispanica]
MAQSSTMIGGDGIYSYQKNSTLQRDGFEAAKKVIISAITNNLDIEKILIQPSKTIAIADLGCSVGPNTFFAMQTIIQTLQHKHHHFQFQVFFNDQTSNDFNTLFASLPHPRPYFAAAVPGSFYGRLFPSSSLHIAFSSSSLHWLSRVPPPLQLRDSPAWNPERIHYTGASDAVVEAYADQFEEDMGVFLRSRAEEIVEGGIVIIIMPGVDDGVVTHDVGIAITFLGCILMDMVKEGMLSQDKVDTLNVPHVYPSVKQMRRAMEKNGCFEIVEMEIRNARSNQEAPIDIESAVMHLRALAESTMANHLGSHIVEELFNRAVEKKTLFSQMLYSAGIQIGSQLFALLKRNDVSC